VFDVLSSAGSPEAQASVRRLLDVPGAKKDPGLYSMLIQRFALVGSPTPESIAHLRDLERTSDGDLSRAALVSRSAALGKRLAAGDQDAELEARDLLARARGDLSNATAAGRDALVKAIGNMRHPDATTALEKHAKDIEPGVRASVATALGRSRSDQASKLLLQMMSDEDSFVARSAISAHLGRRLTAEELGAFADHVRFQPTNAQADAPLASAIVQHSTTDATKVRQGLDTLLARAPENSEHAGRLRAAIAGLGA